MKKLQEIWQDIRDGKAGARVRVAVMLAAVVLAVISWQMKIEHQASLTETARQFESTPAVWLDHPQDISQFQGLVTRHEIAAAAVSFPWVLYTTKSNEHHAAKFMCEVNTACNEVTKLSADSVEGQFPLATVDVETRKPIAQWVHLATTSVGQVASIATSLLMLFLFQSYMSERRKSPELLDKVPETRFADVIGVSEAKASLERVRRFIKDPAKYGSVGARPPRGVLFVGPPGTGKTLLARALAGECGANFISVDGSHFTSRFYGVGVDRVESLFKLARDHAPCVIFIDEIDAIGQRHGKEHSSAGTDENNRIVNRLLVKMDGFESNEGVIVVAATNHPDNIDPALLRAGRFDSVVHLQLPNLIERQELFQLYLANVQTSDDIDVVPLARMAQGASPADIENLVNKAASTAAELGLEKVTNEHLMRALETHQLGGEVSNVKGMLSSKSRKRLAVHEAGHALVAHVLNTGTVDRISIEPRGSALGVTYIARETEDPLFEATHLQSQLATMLAGRAAELMMLKELSTGAGDDLQRATAMAIRMVGNLGLGGRFGLVSLAGVPKELVGDQLQQDLIGEVRTILGAAQAACEAVLNEHRVVFGELVERLLEVETMSGSELQAVLSKTTRAAVCHTIDADSVELIAA